MGFQPGMDIRALLVDGVPESAYCDLQLGCDARRPDHQLFRQQLLGRPLSQSTMVEQPQLLV
jgi:hypothetical protein